MIARAAIPSASNEDPLRGDVRVKDEMPLSFSVVRRKNAVKYSQRVNEKIAI